MALMSTLLFIFSYFSLILAQNIQTCFNRFGNCDIIYSDPYSRVWRIGTDECLQNCALDVPKCKAVIYDVTFSICNLYPFTGNSGPGFLIPAFKKVYYQVNDTTCLTNFNNNNNGGGLPVGTITAPTVTLGPTLGPLDTSATSGTLFPPITSASATLGPLDTSATSGTLFPSITSPSATLLPPLSLTSAGPISRLQRLGCPKGEHPVYLGLMETTVIAPPGANEGPTVSDVGDPATCIKACSQNEDSKGKEFECHSFTFDGANQKCTFHPYTPTPNGPAEITKTARMNTFVKACIKVTPQNSKCNNAMLITASNVELNGHVIKSLNDVTSLADCTELCLNDAKCKSVNYYSRSKLCKLNDASSMTAPDAIASAKTDDAYLIENTCGSAGKQQNVDRAAVNRFNSKIDKETDTDLLDLQKSPQEKVSKPPKKNQIIDTPESTADFAPWGQWTECLRRTQGINVRIRVRLCKIENSPSCRGKKAEYQTCNL